MSEAKFTPQELEARQQARGQVTIDTVRDVMCFENPSRSPEEAAFLLSTRYSQYSYESFLNSCRLVEEVKKILAEHKSKEHE